MNMDPWRTNPAAQQAPAPDGKAVRSFRRIPRGRRAPIPPNSVLFGPPGGQVTGADKTVLLRRIPKATQCDYATSEDPVGTAKAAAGLLVLEYHVVELQC